MSKNYTYKIQEDDMRYGFLKRIDTDQITRDAKDLWSNQTLCAVNDCLVRIGVVQGEFHWHKHDKEDEFFFVVSGKLFIDLEGGEIVELVPHQGYCVPKGVVHRTRATEKTAMLMVEGRTVKAVGDE